jgi:hypothetical protein
MGFKSMEERCNLLLGALPSESIMLRYSMEVGSFGSLIHCPFYKHLMLLDSIPHP